MTSLNNTKSNKNTKIDYSYLRLPDNDILIELDKKDNEIKSESKKDILKMIDKAHNLLYNLENIEGEDALNDIMNFLFLKFIQPIISDKKKDNKIDLLNKNYYDHLYDDEELTEILSYFTDLSLLTKQPLDAIRKMTETTDIIRQMGEILKTHPITGQIFTENNFIKTKKASTIQELLNKVIIPSDIKDIQKNEDVIGEIYEYIINGYVKKGSKLGQFFTPRKLMKLIFKYKQPKINKIIKKIDKEEKIKFYDSCMGTGGWLVTGYNIFKEKYGNRILLSGGEIKSTTFQYGLMNLILTLKKFPHDVGCESSLTHLNDNKHHFILTNPPFQTDKKFLQLKKNFNSDEYTKKNNIKLDDVYNLKNNSPPIQFLELDKYKLEKNGLCLIILPYGELFFGSSNKTVREYFMKETRITDIILFEGGTFTHTGIKTCALIFENNKKGTKEINFIEANKDCNKLTKITTVSIEDIKKEPNYSWYLRDYLKDEYIEKLSSKLTNFEWIEFGEIFTLEKGKLQSSKVKEDENGDVLFITKANINEKTKKIKSIKYFNEGIFIANAFNGNGKCPIRYSETKCINSDLMLYCRLNNNFKNKINIKYIYYFLKSIQEHIETTYEKGSCNKSLDKKNFNKLKIPIPSLEEQTKIIQDIMELEENKKDILKGIESNKNMRKKYMETMIMNATNKDINKVMRLGDIINIDFGKRITKDKNGNDNGKYPVYGGGDISYYTDVYNRNGMTCKISRFGISEKTCVMIIKGKYYLNDAGLTVCSKNIDIVTNNYLWNYLILIKKSIFNTCRGTAQEGLGIELFKILKIPVPPLYYQESIKKTLDNLDKLDESLNIILNDTNHYIKSAFLDSLDKYGNPNGFNLDQLIQFDSKEKIKKSKSKNKSANL